VFDNQVIGVSFRNYNGLQIDARPD